MKLERKEQLRAARKVHTVALANGLELQLIDPTLADAKGLQGCAEDVSAVAKVLQPLIVGDDRQPIFDSADELAQAIAVTDVLAICEFIGKLYDRKAAGKN